MYDEYTRDRNVCLGWLLAGNQDKHQNFDPSLLSKLLFMIFLLHPHENQSKYLGKQEWVELLMFALVSSQKSSRANISVLSVQMTKYQCSNYLGPWYLIFIWTNDSSIFFSINKYTFKFFSHEISKNEYGVLGAQDSELRSFFGRI